jgi:REP element-mobilizing transposase RayT
MLTAATQSAWAENPHTAQTKFSRVWRFCFAVCPHSDGEAIEVLRPIFSKVCTDFEAQLVQIDGQGNHVHLLVNRLITDELLEEGVQLRAP